VHTFSKIQAASSMPRRPSRARKLSRASRVSACSKSSTSSLTTTGRQSKCKSKRFYRPSITEQAHAHSSGKARSSLITGRRSLRKRDSTKTTVSTKFNAWMANRSLQQTLKKQRNLKKRVSLGESIRYSFRQILCCCPNQDDGSTEMIIRLQPNQSPSTRYFRHHSPRRVAWPHASKIWRKLCQRSRPKRCWNFSTLKVAHMLS